MTPNPRITPFDETEGAKKMQHLRHSVSDELGPETAAVVRRDVLIVSKGFRVDSFGLGLRVTLKT